MTDSFNKATQRPPNWFPTTPDKNNTAKSTVQTTRRVVQKAVQRTLKPNLKLTFLYENATKFNDHPLAKGLNQGELEDLYAKLWKEAFAKGGSRDSVWSKFKKKYGMLLAPDRSGVWGDGAALFRVKPTDTGKQMSIAESLGMQTRVWRGEFLTQAGTGTPLKTEQLKGLYADVLTGKNMDIHHIHGINEASPFVDASVNKYVSGLANDDAVKLGTALDEFRSAHRIFHDLDLKVGDVIENYVAAPMELHHNTPQSIHARVSEALTDFISKNVSSDLVEDDLIPFQRLVAESGETGLKAGRGTEGILDKLNKLNRNPLKYHKWDFKSGRPFRIRKPGGYIDPKSYSIFDAYVSLLGLTDDVRRDIIKRVLLDKQNQKYLDWENNYTRRRGKTPDNSILEGDFWSTRTKTREQKLKGKGISAEADFRIRSGTTTLQGDNIIGNGSLLFSDGTVGAVPDELDEVSALFRQLGVGGQRVAEDVAQVGSTVADDIAYAGQKIWDVGKVGRAQHLDNARALFKTGAPIARKLGALVPVVGAGFDIWDERSRAGEMNKKLATQAGYQGSSEHRWDQFQHRLALGTVGTTWWAEPANFAMGVGNLGIDLVRSGDDIARAVGGFFSDDE